MRINDKEVKVIGVLLLILVVLSFASIQMVAATNASPGIDKAEKAIIAELSKYDLGDEEGNLKKAMEISARMKEQARKEVLESVKEHVGGMRADYIFLGTDKTFDDADEGDYGESSWGFGIGEVGSGYNLDDRECTATVILGPLGICGAEAWSWVGKYFNVYGQGSDTANIYMEGWLYGLTSAFAAGSSESELRLVIYDVTAESETSEEIYHKTASGAQYFYVNEAFDNYKSVSLTAGHSYIVYLESVQNGGIYVTGEAGADFGDEDYDPGYADYDTIEIDF